MGVGDFLLVVVSDSVDWFEVEVVSRVFGEVVVLTISS